MSERIRVIHKEIIAGSEVTFRLDILDDEYSGIIREFVAAGSFFRWTYEELDEENPFQNPLQGSEVVTNVLFSAGDEGTFSIVDDIRNSVEDRFETRLFVNDVHKWTGKVNMRLLEYQEKNISAGVEVEITAKDTPGTKSKFPLSTANENLPLITILSECLKATGLTLPISSYTTLTHRTVDETVDFLREFYVQRYHFRDYNAGGDAPRRLSYKEVVDNICRRFNLIIRQANNRWHIIELPGVAKGSALQSNYNSDGVFQSSETYNKSVSVDNSTSFIRDSSRNRVRSPLKRIISTYKHKTLISSFDFAGEYEHTLIQDRSSEIVDIDNTEGLNIELTGQARVRISGAVSGPESGRYAVLNLVGVREGTTDLFYDSGSQSWGSTGEVRVPVNATSGDLLTGSINMSGVSIPSDVDSIKVEFAWAVIPDQTVTNVKWQNFDGRLVSGDLIADSAAITFEYERTGQYTMEEEMAPVLIGQGPTSFSRGAIRYLLLGQWPVLTDGFRTRGETDNEMTLEQVVLRERMGLFRNGSRNLLSEMWLNFDADHLIEYQGDTWFFLGGTLTGNGGWWNGPILQLTDQSDPNDIFSRRLVDDETGVSVNGTDISIVGDVERSKQFNKDQIITETTASLSGTVDTIPIEALNLNFISVGEPFYLFNLQGASLTEFILAEPQLPGATSLKVQPVTLTETIVVGSWVVFTGERIANYITRSSDGIRLGVRSYSQAITEDGDSYVDQDGNGYVFVDEGDQTAINQGTTAEIAILQGEIVLKATAGGNLALVRLDAKPESGSLVEIQADNINLQGLVTAINSGGSETQIDGGKIKADTSVIVGTGDNIAALTGAHPTVRMYAGNADPAAAPFRVLQDGSVIGTKFVQLSGEDVDGVIEQFSIRDLLVTGALTIGTDGMLRTSDDETVFGEDGIQFSTPEIFTTKNSLVWVSGAHENAHITAFASGNIPLLEYKSRQHRFRDDENNTFMIMNRFDPSLSDLGKNMQLVPDTISIDGTKLPNSRSAAGAAGGVYVVQQTEAAGDYWELRIRRTN